VQCVRTTRNAQNPPTIRAISRTLDVSRIYPGDRHADASDERFKMAFIGAGVNLEDSGYLSRRLHDYRRKAD
jgi:hypothetical protein